MLLSACCARSHRHGCRDYAAQQKCAQTVYDVRDYGVKGDGVTDDAPAIQALLDYAMDHGGGTIHFPRGQYRLATIHEKHNVRAHLIVKPKSSPSGVRDYVMLRLSGENCVVTPCSYASHTSEDRSEVWSNGTVLFSDVLGELQTDASLPPVSLLAAGSGANLYSLNQAVIRIQDLAFRAKAEEGGFPRLSGINMAYAATVYTDNVLVLTSPAAAGHYSAGFIGPRLWCNPEQELRNTYVKSAFRYGFVFSEHMNGNNLSVWNCDNAYVFGKMDHSCWFGRIHAQNCADILVSLDTDFAGHVRGASFLRIEQVGIEVNSGQKPVDFNYRTFVLDPENLLYGSFDYHIVKSNVGADNSYFKAVGGIHLEAEPLFRW